MLVGNRAIKTIFCVRLSSQSFRLQMTSTEDRQIRTAPIGGGMVDLVHFYPGVFNFFSHSISLLRWWRDLGQLSDPALQIMIMIFQ